MSGLKGRRSGKLKQAMNKLKKAKSLQFKIWTITAFGLPLAVVVVLPILVATIFLAMFPGIIGRDNLPKESLPPDSHDCPCGCILLGSGANIQPNGSYGFTTGSLKAGSLEEEALKLMQYVAETKGTAGFRPYSVWVHMAVETSAGVTGEIGKLYNTSPVSIYDDLMMVSDSVNRNVFGGDPYKNSAVATGEMVGPFQISSSNISAWTEHVSSEVIQTLGGVDPGFESRSGGVGHPLYLPDVLNKLVTKIDSEQKTGEQFLKDWAPDNYEALSDDGKYFASETYGIFGYYGVPVNSVSETEKGQIARFMCDVVGAWCKNPEGVENVYGGVQGWSQGGYYNNESMKALCDYLESQGYENHYSNYQNWQGVNAKNMAGHYKSGWCYIAKGFVAGIRNYRNVVLGQSSGYCDGKFPSGTGATGSVQTGVMKAPTNTMSATLDWSQTALVGDSLTVGLKNSTDAGSTVGEINAGTGRALSLTSTGSDSTQTVKDTVGKKTIIMTLGVNSAGETETVFKGHYEEVLSTLKTNNPDANIFIGTLTPVDEGKQARNGYNVPESKVKALNEVIRAVASEQGVNLIDSAAYFEGQTAREPKEYSSDGIHMTLEGYEVWWSCIREAVTEFYQQKSSNTSGQATSTAVNKLASTLSGQQWSCNCLIPCPYCHCHDDGIANNGSLKPNNGAEINNSGIVGGAGSFPAPQAGQASGIWGTTEQLTNWVNNMGTESGGVLASGAKQLIPHMGKAPHQVVEGTWRNYTDWGGPDRYIGADGYGFIRYLQAPNAVTEEYGKVQYSTGEYGTLRGGGCGVFSTAMVMSTLEKKWVSPAEVIVAWGTAKQRIGHVHSNSGGPIAASEIYCLFKEAGYHVETGIYAGCGEAKDEGVKFTKERLDACLDSGGMVIYVTTDSQLAATSAHYVVIRERNSNGNYVIGNCVDTNYLGAEAVRLCLDYPFDRIVGNLSRKNSGQTVFIYGKGQASTEGACATYPVFGYDSLGNAVSNRLTSDIRRSAGGGSYGDGSFHGGIDLIPGNGTGLGSAVYSVADGVVKAAGSYIGGADRGYVVVVEHDSGGRKWCTEYQHLHMIPKGIAPGATVTAGTKIGEMGGTGRNLRDSDYGVHLHFEVYCKAWEEVYSVVGRNTIGGKGILVDGLSVIGGRSVTGMNISPCSNVFELTTITRVYSPNRYGEVVQQGSDYQSLVQRYSYAPNGKFKL